MQELEFLQGLVLGQRNYSGKVVGLDMTTPGFFKEQIVALIDEVYELNEVKHLPDIALEELVDTYCFIGNLLVYYIDNFDIDLTVIGNCVNERNFKLKKIPASTTAIVLWVRNLIRGTKTWKSWKPNNPSKTNPGLVSRHMIELLVILKDFREFLIERSETVSTLDEFYTKYQGKVKLNTYKQLGEYFGFRPVEQKQRFFDELFTNKDFSL